MLLGWAEGKRGHPGQDSSFGEGDDYPSLKITILQHIPWEAVTQQGGARLGVPRRIFSQCSAPLVGFFLGVGALIRGNVWDVLP